MSENLIPVEPENFYHVYNHAVGADKFFNDSIDYNFFLSKTEKYLIPFYEIFAFSLLPNHFHLILRAKAVNQIEQVLDEYYADPKGLYRSSKDKPDRIEFVLSKCLSNLFNCYAKNYNTRNSRKGTLFIRAFRRKHISDEDYLRDLIIYLHQNPVAAGLRREPSHWKFSSYNAIINETPTLVERHQVLDLFDNIENFIFCNNKKHQVEFTT